MNGVKEVDVLVVGGGPAGLQASRAVASAGHSTILLEKEPDIATSVRTSGGVSIETLRQFNVPPNLYHPIKKLRVCSHRETASFEYGDPIGGVIDVRGVYRFLASQARERNAKILTGASAVMPLSRGDFVIGATVDSDAAGELTIHSKILIDAGGYKASISRKAGLHQGFKRFGVGAEYELLAESCSQDEAVILVGNRYAPSGYAWVFPCGEDRVRVGVGILHADSRADPKQHLDVFISEARKVNVDLSGCRQIEYHHGLIPSDGLAPRFVGNGIMAVGDAAGQASLVAGEGIRLSMIAGKLAGTTAANAITNGQLDREALLPYEKSFRSKYALKLKLSHMANVKMAAWDDEKWDEQVRTIRSIPPNLMAKALQAEFSPTQMLRWISTHPSLWPRMSRYLLKVLASVIRNKKSQP